MCNFQLHLLSYYFEIEKRKLNIVSKIDPFQSNLKQKMDEIDEGLDEVFLLDENSYEQNYQNELKKQIEMSVDKYKEAGYKNPKYYSLVKIMG